MEDRRLVRQHLAMTSAAPTGRLPMSLAIAVLAFGLAGCGGSSGKQRSTSMSNAVIRSEHAKFDADKDTDGAHPDEDELVKPPAEDRDNDADNNGKKTRYDSDDTATIDFGHKAGSSDTRQISAIVRSYYAVAVAEDGVKACEMLYSTYAEAVPEDYGVSPPGPSFSQGKTCPAVMTLIFKHFHDQLSSRLPKLKVAQVRVKGRQGLAILNFGPILSEHEIHVEREGHTWKIVALIDNNLP
jgi:hypothetical protein